MKTDNILVFLNQTVKLGDFGISFRMKARGNKLKGFTPGYLPEDLELALIAGKEFKTKTFTKQELIGLDTFAIIKTFEKIIESTKDIPS